MEITDIAIWLRTGGEYNTGVDLYHKYKSAYGTNHSLNFLLKKEPSLYSKQKLKSVLSAFNEKHKKKTVVVTKKNKAVIQHTWKDTKAEELPPDLAVKRKAISEIYHGMDQRIGVHRHLIYNSNGQPRRSYDKKKAKKQADEITDMHKRLEALWDEINHFKQTGERLIPAPAPDSIMERLFNLADENKDVKQLLSDYTQLIAHYHIRKNRKSKTKAQVDMAEKYLQQHKDFKTHYENRY